MQGRPVPPGLQELRGRLEIMAQTAAWACQAHQERLECKAVLSRTLIPHCYLFPWAGWTFPWKSQGATGEGTRRRSNKLMPIVLQGFLELLAHRDHPAHLVRSLPFKDHARCFLAGTTTSQCQSHSLRCRHSKHWGPRHAWDSRHPRASGG